MSLVYLVTELPDNPIIDIANTVASFAPPLTEFSALLTRLLTFDFSNYDQRRSALRQLATLSDPHPLTNTASFDILQFPLIPPFVQQRFPATGAFVPIRNILYATPLAVLTNSLSYTADQGPITDASVPYYAALDTLTLLTLDPLTILTRATFELEYLLIWQIYPVPPP